VGQDLDAGSGVGSSDADVPELAGDAQRDGACLVDPVGADAVVGVGGAVGAGGGESRRVSRRLSFQEG